MKRQVKVGKVLIGGGAPVSVQSMLNVKTSDVRAALPQIQKLEKAGCDIVRLAVRDERDAAAFSDLKKETNVPLVADIHFDYRLAIAAAKAGADKIRINPGNIGDDEKVGILADFLGERNVPIRIGVNGGSLDKKFSGLEMADAMAESAMYHASLLEKFGFKDIVISAKSSSVRDMIAAYEKLNEICDYPLHLGVTEAGTLRRSLVKSSVGIGSLLLKGIGDTIRVSVTGDPTEEAVAANYLLKSLGLRGGVDVVSCPTCGRTEIEVEKLSEAVEKLAAGYDKNLTVAVMGCVVNGIGEGKHADFGVAGGKDKSVIFRNGEKYKVVSNDEILSELEKLFREYDGKQF